MKFILSIDTEADNQWDHGCELSVNNIRFIPRFQRLCEKYQIIPTYLVTSEVCDDSFAKVIFTDYISRNAAEVGSHLHSWSTPPFKDLDGFKYNDKWHAFATELPEVLLEEKISKLTSQIDSSFGKRPLSFRSGRYGFDETVAKILIKHSYLVDSSVTPFVNWTSHIGIPGYKGGPDFLDKTPYPYRYGYMSGSLIEIPISILPTIYPLNKYHKLARKYFKVVDNSYFLRLLRKLFFANQPLWLRPFEWMDISLFKKLIDEAIKIELPFIVMMFHSSELMPGGSKYRPDEAAIDRLYSQLEDLFILLNNYNIISISMTDAAKEYKL
jgi:hypothetical protein